MQNAEPNPNPNPTLTLTLTRSLTLTLTLTKVCSSDSERIAWRSGEPAAPAPPPELEGQPWITDQMIYRRIVPTVCLVCGLFLGMIYYQHLKRRRLHQRIAQRV